MATMVTSVTMVPKVTYDILWALSSYMEVRAIACIRRLFVCPVIRSFIQKLGMKLTDNSVLKLTKPVFFEKNLGSSIKYENFNF